MGEARGICSFSFQVKRKGAKEKQSVKKKKGEPSHKARSNCEDFEKDPQRWGFRKTEHPEVGDIVIQHEAGTGRAFHACIIVDIKDGKYFVNHAIRKNYFKNVEMKNVNNLTFYEFVK